MFKKINIGMWLFAILSVVLKWAAVIEWSWWIVMIPALAAMAVDVIYIGIAVALIAMLVKID